MTITIDEMAAFCKRKGFVYSSSDLYGGLAGIYDYGPYGAELKRNIMQEWWKYHVQSREDIVGMDGAIISHQGIWNASGHLDAFSDPMAVCTKCKHKDRVDTLIEEKTGLPTDGLSMVELGDLVKKHNIVCPHCKGSFQELQDFNLMFPVQMGAETGKKGIAYLRGETAQLIFSNFKLIHENARLKLPFGIAQMGKAFRNEISPRNFLFRMREFDQMEIEYFIHPKQKKCPYIKDVEKTKLIVYTVEDQEKKRDPSLLSVKDVVAKKIMTEWHAYWLAIEQNWFTDLGINPKNLRLRQHLKKEKSHYALDTWDLEYEFPFGWKEIEGIANRTDYDLKAHMKESKKDLSIHDDQTNEKVVPHVVAEPSLGVDRSFLIFMFDAFNNDQKRGNIVLKLHPKLAPVKVAVFPLVSNKEPIVTKAREVYMQLKDAFPCFFDKGGSIGRRYARQDELGTPFCVTIDFDTLKDSTVTVRNRDTTEQKRVKIEELRSHLQNRLKQ